MRNEVFMKKLIEYTKKVPTLQLTSGIGLLAIFVLYGTYLLKDSSLFRRFAFLDKVGAALGFCIGGCIGLVYIVRREYILPFGYKLKGEGVVLFGIVILLLGLSLATMFLLFIWM